MLLVAQDLHATPSTLHCNILFAKLKKITQHKNPCMSHTRYLHIIVCLDLLLDLLHLHIVWRKTLLQFLHFIYRDSICRGWSSRHHCYNILMTDMWNDTHNLRTTRCSYKNPLNKKWMGKYEDFKIVETPRYLQPNNITV